MDEIEHGNWRAIRRGANRRQLTEASLVLTAVELPHVIVKDDEHHDWCLKVPDQVAPEAISGRGLWISSIAVGVWRR